MRLIFKILAIFLILSFLLVLSYELLGSRFEVMLNQEQCARWFARIKPYGWLIGIGLLVLDILLPVPATGVMAALGKIYGIIGGTLAGAAGTGIAGLVGYGMARLAGKHGSRWVASGREIERFRHFFDRWGGYAVIISRAMPVMPEVITILAGLSGMRFYHFAAALMAGAFPVAFFFAWIGAYPGFSSTTGIIIATLIPLLIWPIFNRMVKM